MEDASLAESLVRRAAAGDELACARLVDEHYAPMVRAAYVITGDAELAREATQIAWGKVWPRLGTLKDPDRIRPWLVAIAANESRQLIRRQRRRTVHEIAASTKEGRRGSGREDRGRGPPAGRRQAARSRSGAAGDALRGRPRFVRDRAQAGISASGVRSRLARLLDRLRQELDDA